MAVLRFFLHMSEDHDGGGRKEAFLPLRVANSQVGLVVALVAEYAETFHNKRSDEKTARWCTTESAMARSVLDKAVVELVRKSFTRKGVRELAVGAGRGRRRNYPKRSEIIKVSRKVEKEENKDATLEEIVPVEKEENKDATL